MTCHPSISSPIISPHWTNRTVILSHASGSESPISSDTLYPCMDLRLTRYLYLQAGQACASRVVWPRPKNIRCLSFIHMACGQSSEQVGHPLVNQLGHERC